MTRGTLTGQGKTERYWEDMPKHKGKTNIRQDMRVWQEAKV